MLLLFALLAGDPGFTIKWDKNYLEASAPGLPGEFFRIHYLEAYLRSGTTNRDWLKSMIPHRTDLVSATPKRIALRCKVNPSVVVDHMIDAGRDEITFRIIAKNLGTEFADVQWAQPCMRVDRFTGMKQDDYFHRCFIVTNKGPVLLHETRRTDKALYTPGQVYVPKGIKMEDVNPRPISPERPTTNLIGCYSADGKTILATAFDNIQELFQGVGVCIHADFRIGGLKPGEEKKLLGKVYWVPADLPKLMKRYEKDFPNALPKR